MTLNCSSYQKTHTCLYFLSFLVMIPSFMFYVFVEIDLYVFLRFYIVAVVVIMSLNGSGISGNEYDLDINFIYGGIFSADVKNSLHKVDGLAWNTDRKKLGIPKSKLIFLLS